MSSLLDIERVRQSYQQPLFVLLDQARRVHCENFPNGEIQAASLLSIKTGGCPENCAYCPQSAHYKTGVAKTRLMPKSAVLDAAAQAKRQGATRFCMGAAWRNVHDGDEFEQVLELVEAVNSTGLEVCCTLGMLTQGQAERLKQAGLYAYNHNLDTSRNYYSNIVQTRTYDDRLRTIHNVRAAGLTVCTGGILGMGETDEDRIALIHQLASLQPQPESLTINMLVPFGGTPLGGKATDKNIDNNTDKNVDKNTDRNIDRNIDKVDDQIFDSDPVPSVSPIEVMRVIATLRVLAPRSMIRLSAGRLSLSDDAQFLCFYAGANSIFLGDKLLTSRNPTSVADATLMQKLGYQLQPSKKGFFV